MYFSSFFCVHHNTSLGLVLLLSFQRLFVQRLPSYDFVCSDEKIPRLKNLYISRPSWPFREMPLLCPLSSSTSCFSSSLFCHENQPSVRHRPPQKEHLSPSAKNYLQLVPYDIYLPISFPSGTILSQMRLFSPFICRNCTIAAHFSRSECINRSNWRRFLLLFSLKSPFEWMFHFGPMSTTSSQRKKKLKYKCTGAESENDFLSLLHH